MMAVGTEKVAVITGGSGGMGLIVARALVAQGGWQIHILDIKDEEGRQAASELAQTTFHKVDLVNYDEVAAAFKAAFTAGGGNRLDFVFANAGMFERSDFFARSDSPDPPPPPDFTTLNVNLNGAINTVLLARHYLNLSPEKGSIVINASCSSFWPTYLAPMYTASKFGVMGFMRCVAYQYKKEGIRVNALCPGAVRTPILSAEAWKVMPDDVFTPPELIADVVLKLAEGREVVDSKGVRVPAEELYGQAIIANGRTFYVHGEPEYPDDVVATTMENTKLDQILST